MNLPFKQNVRGLISLKEAVTADVGTAIKIAVARDCMILGSQVLQIPRSAEMSDLSYNLDFEHDYGNVIGVRLLVGPDVPDEQLLSVDYVEQRISAAEFRKNPEGSDLVSAFANVGISAKMFSILFGACRIYTLRGRVVCRKLVWNPILRRFVVCDAPVRGARVSALDVDRYWWWYRKNEVGSDLTDVNGYFEIKFTWCCRWWRPWYFENWVLDPSIVRRVQDLTRLSTQRIELPKPEPEPDFTLFQRILSQSSVQSTVSNIAAGASTRSPGDFVQAGLDLARILPPAPELEAIHVWPWYRRFDCRPDIQFQITQDCGNGKKTIYTENPSDTRWDIGTDVSGIVLVANQEACCGPFCCVDYPDHDCLVIDGVGCGSSTTYPIEHIEQDLGSPLLGYAQPGTEDRPFGGAFYITGAFGALSTVDYYKVQRRMIRPTPGAWIDLPASEVGAFNRTHWTGTAPDPTQTEFVELEAVDGQNVLRTLRRYRAGHPGVDSSVSFANHNLLLHWQTADSTTSPLDTPLLNDGVYELRVIGYRLENGKLVEQQIMPICPETGGKTDPNAHAGLRLRLDNREYSEITGKVHLATAEPNCDFPLGAIVVNEGTEREQRIIPCGFARVRAGDKISIKFTASDLDGHLDHYTLSASWGESETFNILAAGTLVGDPTLPAISSYSALPPASGPLWYGGQYKVIVTVDTPVEVDKRVFETCCAYTLKLTVWKRTTNGCGLIHANTCEYSFTLIREDLIGNTGHPGCTSLCDDAQPTLI